MGNELIGDVFEDVRVIRYGTIEKILDEEQTFLGCGSVVDVPVVEEISGLADGLDEGRDHFAGGGLGEGGGVLKVDFLEVVGQLGVEILQLR